MSPLFIDPFQGPFILSLFGIGILTNFPFVDSDLKKLKICYLDWQPVKVST